MLADLPVAQWKNWLRFQLVDDASPYLSDELYAERFAFYNKTLNGQQEQSPRWKRVLNTLENGAGEAMGAAYVEVAYPPEAKARMDELVTNLSAALKDHIGNLAWMSDATRAKALEKWAAFTPKIGFPTRWRDFTGLRTARDSYYGNVEAAQEFNYKWDIGKIGKPVGQDRMAVDAADRQRRLQPAAERGDFPPPPSCRRRSSTRRPTMPTTTAASAR